MSISLISGGASEDVEKSDDDWEGLSNSERPITEVDAEKEEICPSD